LCLISISFIIFFSIRQHVKNSLVFYLPLSEFATAGILIKSGLPAGSSQLETFSVDEQGVVWSLLSIISFSNADKLTDAQAICSSAAP
jgi:hypothetical protein